MVESMDHPDDVDLEDAITSLLLRSLTKFRRASDTIWGVNANPWNSVLPMISSAVDSGADASGTALNAAAWVQRSALVENYDASTVATLVDQVSIMAGFSALGADPLGLAIHEWELWACRSASTCDKVERLALMALVANGSRTSDSHPDATPSPPVSG
jgi:hypothetical protein